MNPQLNKKDTKRPPIGVIMTAIRLINTDQVREDDEAKVSQVMMKMYRGITRKDIISRRDGEEVMKEEVGRDNAPGIGRGNDCTEEERKEVGGDGIDRWQVKRVRKEKGNWRRRH